MNRNPYILLVIVAVLATGSIFAGCATVSSSKPAGDAKSNFEAAEQALKSGDFIEATRLFDHVRYKYPYSSQAALADLAIGDIHFKQDKYLEAIEAYRSFLKLHPTHPKADYAHFQIALSYYKNMPSDFFLFPSPTEKDQTSVRESRTAFEEFLKQFPQSQWAAEANKSLTDLKNRQAMHELRIANYYLDHDRWVSAVGRLNRLLTDFPGCALEAEALFKLGRAQLKMEQKDKAREALQRLVQLYPNDKNRAEAEQLLKTP